MKIGQRVRYSGYVTQQKRDYWNNCGREPAKSVARKALDDAIATRGTGTALLPGDASRGASPGLEVTWDDGTKSQCLGYIVMAA